VARVVALLRGINLAKRHRVAMADLRELLDGMGYENVRTHLQSGNVILDSSEKAADVERTMAKALEDRFGFAIPVIVRTAKQLESIVEADPLGDLATEPKLYLVAFCDGTPKLPDVDAGDEQFVVKGREIFMWCPNGFNDSRLRKAFTDRALGVTATTRNWRTLTKLNDLAGAD
jgi:uncharacterized protein (DUF1697 family)